MIRNIVVSYTVRPEAVDEHVRLIEGVFDELRAAKRADVEYKVMRLADGVSFIHVSTADTPDGANPLTALESFREFSRNLPARVATQPNPTAADIIGTYHPAG
ncbi:MAG TPA: hypothetical protein VKB69_07035 [Micromonosporaceae bacterium]|nr:hypothetical protein [Micromonosporaceae bacterium]